jgi:hypothetical protein
MRTFAWTLGGALAGVALAASAVATVDYPALSALPSGVRLFAIGNCPATIDLIRKIENSPQGSSSILVLPADDEDSALRDRICRTLSLQLADRCSWLRFFPSAGVCKWITNEAVLFRHLNFRSSPALAIDMHPLPPGTTTEDARAVYKANVYTE